MCWQVAVHLDCYRRLKNPIGSWKCEVCEEMSLQPRSPRNQTDGWDRFRVVPQCGLCGGATGAFRKSIDGRWVHAFCAEVNYSFFHGQFHYTKQSVSVPWDVPSHIRELCYYSGCWSQGSHGVKIIW